MRSDEPLPERALDRLLETGTPLADEADWLPESPAPDKYRVLRVIGRGGMGIVCEAEDLHLGRRVALKLLRERFSDAPDATARLRREAMVVARLSHPNIAAVYEATDHYIAMELIDGGTLGEREDADPRRVATWIRDAARAVHRAHEAQIIHRDLKPQNIMVDRAGERVFVTDFGLAKEVAVDSSLSATGRVLGTPAFMAPEQARGQSDLVGIPTDVYGLGATLYALLAERPPFGDGDVYDTLKSIVESEPPPLDAELIAADLRTIVMKCLEKDPARRYATAADLADDLDRWLTGRSIVARPPTRLERWRSGLRRHRGLVVGLVASAGAIALVSAIWVPLFLNEKESLGNVKRELAQEKESKVTVQRELDSAQRAFAQRARIVQILGEAQLAGRLGELARERDLLDEGIALCGEALATAPVAPTHFLQGRLLRARGRLVEARAALDEALSLEPALGEAHFERGTLVVDLLAELFYQHRELYAVDAESPDPRVRTFSVFERMFPQVRFLRQLAAADLSVDVGESSILKPIDGAFGQAELARLVGENDRAREALQAILDEEPLYFRASLSLATLALEAGDWNAALQRATEAIERHRGLTAAYALRSRAKLALALEQPRSPESRRRIEESLADADTVIELSEQAVEPLFERGRRHLALQNWTEAIRDFDAVLDHDDGHERAWASRGEARWRRAIGESEQEVELLERAERDLRRALELRPGIPRFHELLGQIFHQRARSRDETSESAALWLAQSRQEFDQAVSSMPEFVAALRGRAEVITDLATTESEAGRTEAAEKLFEQAITDARATTRAAPTSARSWTCLGEVARASGETIESLQAFGRALELEEPDGAPAAHLRARLRELGDR